MYSPSSTVYHQSSTQAFLKYFALKTSTELKSEWDRESYSGKSAMNLMALCPSITT